MSKLRQGTLWMGVLLAVGLAGTVWAAEPTVAELQWHKEAIEAKMQRDQAQSQLLQAEFNALSAELASVNAQLDKMKAEADAKAKAEAEKAKPPEPSK